MAEAKKNPLIGAYRDPLPTVAADKPAEQAKPATDPKTAAATTPPSAKAEEKKPAEQAKPTADTKDAAAATATPSTAPEGSKPDEQAKPTTDTKDAAAATATPPTAPEGKKPAEQEKPPTDPKTETATVSESSAERTADGPKGSAITHILEARLTAPTEADLKNLPVPGEGEVFSISLHPAYFRDFLDHPFTVNREVQDYKDLYESIKTYGITAPIQCRPGRDGGLEIVSGHRRHDIGMQLNYPIPTIIEQIPEDDAQIQCVDGNLHRQDIPITELARAAKMKMDALKRKAGRRTKAEILNDPTPQKRSDEIVAEDLGMSRATVQRLVRMDSLTPPLKEMVNKKEISMDTAEQISHLKPDEQTKLADAIEREGGKVPSKSEVVKLKEASNAGTLTTTQIDKTVAPTKREEAPQLKVTFNNEELRAYFPDLGTTVSEVKVAVFQGLDLRKKSLERREQKKAEAQAAAKQDSADKASDPPSAQEKAPDAEKSKVVNLPVNQNKAKASLAKQR